MCASYIKSNGNRRTVPGKLAALVSLAGAKWRASPEPRAAGLPGTAHAQENGVPQEHRWSIESVETACEGLCVLAMVGAPQAPALFEEALGSEVSALRHTALDNVVFLGVAAQPVLPAIAALLEDPDWRMDAVDALQGLYHQRFFEPATELQWQNRVARWKHRIANEPLRRRPRRLPPGRDDANGAR